MICAGIAEITLLSASRAPDPHRWVEVSARLAPNDAGPLPKNGVRALSDAERAAAYRARRKAEIEAAGKAPVVRIRYRKPQDKPLPSWW